MKQKSSPMSDRERFAQGYKARRGDLHIECDGRVVSYGRATAPQPCRVSAQPESQFTGMIAFYDGDDSTVWVNTAKIVSMIWTPRDEVAS